MTEFFTATPVGVISIQEMVEDTTRITPAEQTMTAGHREATAAAAAATTAGKKVACYTAPCLFMELRRHFFDRSATLPHKLPLSQDTPNNEIPYCLY